MRLRKISSEALVASSRNLILFATAYSRRADFDSPSRRTNELNSFDSRERIAPFHSCQTLSAAAAQQSNKEEFHLIIGVMGQCNPRDFFLLRYSCQKTGGAPFGQPSRWKASVVLRVGARRRARRITAERSFSQMLRTRSFIGVAAASTQAMVQMCNAQPPPVHRRKLREGRAAEPWNPVRPKPRPKFSGGDERVVASESLR